MFYRKYLTKKKKMFKLKTETHTHTNTIKNFLYSQYGEENSQK